MLKASLVYGTQIEIIYEAIGHYVYKAEGIGSSANRVDDEKRIK